jgi:Zinc finger, C2H2 type
MQSKLLQHIQKRHTTKYFCEECGEGFIQLLDMMRHKRDTHRPRCFTCDMEFTNQEVLKNHLTTHRTTLDERKKYACQVEGCNKRYTKVHSLDDGADISRLRSRTMSGLYMRRRSGLFVRLKGVDKLSDSKRFCNDMS